LLALLGALSGCLEYRPAPLEPSATAADFTAGRLDDPDLGKRVRAFLPAKSQSWPPKPWNRADLLAVAWVSSPELRVARTKIEAGVAAELSAGLRPNPGLTLESEYARHDSHPWLYGVGLDWPLTGARPRRLRQDVARLETTAQRLELLETAWSIRSRLTGALTQWMHTQRRLALLANLASTQAHAIELTHRRIAAGEDAPFQIVELEHAYRDTEAEITAQRLQGTSAHAAAAAALGMPVVAVDAVDLTWPDWGTPPRLTQEMLQQKREQALLSRADLATAINEYALAETRLKLAVARQYPEISIGPGYYWDHGIAKFPLDVGFTLPLNRNRGEIAEARAARELAGERMLAIQAGILGAIDLAERNESLAREAVATAKSDLAANRTDMTRLQHGIDAGEYGSQQTLTATILRLRAELSVLESQAQMQVARNDLEDAVHAPLSGPELELSQLTTEPPPGS